MTGGPAHLPANRLDARFAQPGEVVERRPVQAFNWHGDALVADPKTGKLVVAKDQPGFLGVDGREIDAPYE